MTAISAEKQLEQCSSNDTTNILPNATATTTSAVMTNKLNPAETTTTMLSMRQPYCIQGTCSSFNESLKLSKEFGNDVEQGIEHIVDNDGEPVKPPRYKKSSTPSHGNLDNKTDITNKINADDVNDYENIELKTFNSDLVSLYI